MEQYKPHKLKVYYTEDDYISDDDTLLDDTFYNEIMYTEKAWDLQYRLFAYRIEVYEADDLFKPIKVFEFKDFNRKKYKENFGSKGEYGTKGLWDTKKEERDATPKWQQDKDKNKQ